MAITSAPTGVDLDVRPLIAPKMAVFMFDQVIRLVPADVSNTPLSVSPGDVVSVSAYYRDWET